MAYIGREPQIGNFQICDAISTVNAQAAYTMQVSSVDVLPETANHMIVSLNGVIQKPNSSYTVSGATITFASNLVTGDVINFIQILGSVLDLGVPSDDTVTAAKLSSNAVTTVKILDANVTVAKMAANSVDSDQYVDGSIDTAHIANDQITLAKMASGTDGNIISYDASGNPVAVATGNDGQVLTSAGAGAVPTFETLPVGGITEIDQFRLTATTNAATDAVVTSNWERVDTDGWGNIGTGLTNSSGVFSFPSTGIYLILFQANFTIGANEASAFFILQTTSDNSTYNNAASAIGSGSSGQLSAGNQFILDVTNVSNDKFRFSTASFASGTNLQGDSNNNNTCFSVTRIGDT
jgi:hypothetical protein